MHEVLRFRLDMAEGSIEKGFILDPEAKMQSRIDEQSELICILKKRADQLLTESKMSFHFDASLWSTSPHYQFGQHQFKKPFKSNERRLKNAEKTNADLVVQVTFW